jgi:hypothetical protein
LKEIEKGKFSVGAVDSWGRMTQRRFDRGQSIGCWAGAGPVWPREIGPRLVFKYEIHFPFSKQVSIQTNEIKRFPIPKNKTKSHHQ